MDSEENDAAFEWRLRLLAIPLALLGAVVLRMSGAGRFITTAMAAMPVHELGHAVSAWLCGFMAIPTPLWRTAVWDTRSVLVSLVLLAALAWGARQAWRHGRHWLAAVCMLFIVLQAWGTLGLDEDRGQAMITFGGDGMGMVIGTLLMTGFACERESALRGSQLRWGLLVIGAIAFVAPFSTWWQARTDVGAIPYGEMEGVALSDPTRLVEEFGWTQQAMVRRYVNLGLACLFVLALAWVAGLRSARQELEQARRSTALRLAAERRAAREAREGSQAAGVPHNQSSHPSTGGPFR